MSKVIIDEPGIYLNSLNEIMLVFPWDGAWVCIDNSGLARYTTGKDGTSIKKESTIIKKIKGIDLYAAFNKAYGKGK